MFNKKKWSANHTATKFAANILCVIESLCSKSGDDRFIIKESYNKKSMDPSLWTWDWSPSVLN